jgi:hypothetical protein
MGASAIVWGGLAVISGIFICAYGYTLFRSVLAGAGLLIGLWLGVRLTVGQDEFVRLLVSLLLGGGFALAFYTLFRLGLYVAGALGGIVIGFVLVGVIGIPDGAPTLIFVVIAAVIGAGLARIVGELAIIFGTSLLGAYAVLFGLSLLFPGELASANSTAYITMTPFNVALLVVIVLIAVFGQFDTRRSRRGVL